MQHHRISLIRQQRSDQIESELAQAAHTISTRDLSSYKRNIRAASLLPPPFGLLKAFIQISASLFVKGAYWLETAFCLKGERIGIKHSAVCL